MAQIRIISKSSEQPFIFFCNELNGLQETINDVNRMLIFSYILITSMVFQDNAEY